MTWLLLLTDRYSLLSIRVRVMKWFKVYSIVYTASKADLYTLTPSRAPNKRSRYIHIIRLVNRHGARANDNGAQYPIPC